MIYGVPIWSVLLFITNVLLLVAVIILFKEVKFNRLRDFRLINKTDGPPVTEILGFKKQKAKRNVQRKKRTRH